MRFSGLLIFILCWTANLYSQTENEVVNDYLERYIENSTDEIDIQQFASDLLYYFDHPLDLNKASATELFEVPFLTGFQSMEIIEHRKTYGDFIELYELQILPSFTLSDIEHLLPFVSLKANSLSSLSLKKIWNQGQHQILSLAETITPNARGFIIADTASVTSSNQYLGSPIYSNLRYRFDFKKHISLGFNAEKDAGEPIFNSEYNRGFDYYSFYFSARDINRIKSLNIGDYQANFGQGLTLSTGLAFGKSSIITNSKRNFNGFGAYRSLRENAYLRGGALSFQLKKIDIGVFTSFKKVDGNAVTSNESSTEDISETNYFTNIQEDGGYHRTLSEFEDKRVVRDMQVGVYGEIKLERGKIGMVSYARKLNSPINPTPQAYNQFSFRGDQYSKTGLYYDYVFRNVNLFGEISHSSFKNSIAQVHGALLSLNKSFDLSLVYRNYDKSFITYQTNGFGENSNASNENGIYTGFQ
ncbi:MAG: helix-hairpin-helix domain-containing protein, partial [Bacteroidia bacterium]